MHTLDEFEAAFPAPAEPEHRPRRRVEGMEAPADPEPVERIRAMLAAIEPTKPYADWIRIVLAVRSQHPDETGFDLVDEWSTEAREANGQQTVRKDPGLWWRTEPHSITFGTLVHYAEEDGYEPPTFEIVNKKREVVVPEIAQTDEYPPLAREELPRYLRAFVEHIAPVTGAWEHDWAEMLALTALSTLFPNLKFENLGLNLWFLGLAPQGVGKGRSGDAAHEATVALAAALGQDLRPITRATQEGYARLLQGHRVSAYAYHEEYASLLADFGKEHMRGIKSDLCALYDGRRVAYHRSKESVEVTEPYLVKVALCQPRAFIGGVDKDDLYNGYLSRFLFCAPNATEVEPEYITAVAREALVAQLREPLLDRQRIHSAQWRQDTWTTVPPAYAAYSAKYGGELGRVHTFVGSLYDDNPEAPGRLKARVKKVAALMDLLSDSPDVRDGVLHVTDGAAALAVRVVERAATYGRMVAMLAGGDPLGRLGNKLIMYLRRDKWAGGMTQRLISNTVGISYADQARLLPALESSGVIARREVGKAVRYVYVGGE